MSLAHKSYEAKRCQGKTTQSLQTECQNHRIVELGKLLDGSHHSTEEGMEGPSSHTVCCW